MPSSGIQKRQQRHKPHKRHKPRTILKVPPNIFLRRSYTVLFHFGPLGPLGTWSWREAKRQQYMWHVRSCCAQTQVEFLGFGTHTYTSAWLPNTCEGETLVFSVGSFKSMNRFLPILHGPWLRTWFAKFPALATQVRDQRALLQIVPTSSLNNTQVITVSSSIVDALHRQCFWSY